jgi:opacity protein-like surface antigen
MCGSIRRRAAFLLAVAVIAPSPAGAETPMPDSDPFGYGAFQIGFIAGHGSGFGKPFGSEGSSNEKVEFALLAPRTGVGISDAWARDSWYGGSFALIGEGQLWWAHEPHNGFGGAFDLTLRYQLLALRERDVVPFIESGAGLGGIDFDLDSQRDGFNFLLQTGAGLHWFLSERNSLELGYRYHHISNAGSRRPNVGINSHVAYLGISYFPR